MCFFFRRRQLASSGSLKIGKPPNGFGFSSWFPFQPRHFNMVPSKHKTHTEICRFQAAAKAFVGQLDLLHGGKRPRGAWGEWNNKRCVMCSKLRFPPPPPFPGRGARSEFTACVGCFFLELPHVRLMMTRPKTHRQSHVVSLFLLVFFWCPNFMPKGSPPFLRSNLGTSCPKLSFGLLGARAYRRWEEAAWHA